MTPKFLLPRRPGLMPLLLINGLAVCTQILLLAVVEPAWRSLAISVVVLSGAALLVNGLRLFRWMRYRKALLARSNGELTRYTAYFKALLDHLPQGISVFDENLQLRFWNQTFIEVLGLPEGVVQQGVSFAELIRYPAERGEYGPGNVAELVQARVEIARRFQAHQLERTRPNGRTHRVEGAPIMMNGEVRGLINDLHRHHRSQTTRKRIAAKKRAAAHHSRKHAQRHHRLRPRPEAAGL